MNEQRATRNMLIVDHDHFYRSALEWLFADMGFDVKTATSSQEAISIAEEFLPDIMVTEWSFGDEPDGIRLAKTVRSHAPHVEVILTAASSSEELVSLAKAENIQFLSKPYPFHKLLAIVKKSDE